MILAVMLRGSMSTAVENQKAKRDVLTSRPYPGFQVSHSVSGNALAELTAHFPIDMSDLASVSDNDLQIIKDARVTAESAETDAGGFNDRIAATTSDDKATQLQNGTIRIEVLKLV